MKKAAKRIVLLLLVIAVLCFTVFLSTWFWPELWGSHSLGNNLYLLDWENDTKIIVYSTSKIGNTCYSGSYIIPSGPISETEEYVTDAAYDGRYVILSAYLFNEDKYTYYIISKDFDPNNYPYSEITKNKVHPFADYSVFVKKCDSLGISHLIPSRWH
ncbi:MAG: hypothetical protein IKX67_08900 [Bacteroidales bacterium]|nr:hypothetical protein [Bacteroidales bacterium]